VVPSTVGAGAARVTVLDASPRPLREDRVIVTDTGEGGKQLADYLLERGLA
jgi:electron transfer flavoprotein beta subunit